MTFNPHRISWFDVSTLRKSIRERSITCKFEIENNDQNKSSKISMSSYEYEIFDFLIPIMWKSMLIFFWRFTHRSSESQVCIFRFFFYNKEAHLREVNSEPLKWSTNLIRPSKIRDKPQMPNLHMEWFLFDGMAIIIRSCTNDNPHDKIEFSKA